MLKYGKRPAIHSARTMRGALAVARAFDPLGAPPPASNPYYQAVEAVVGDDWGMFANGPDPHNPPQIQDGVGDCTMADGAHQLMLRTANASSIVIPTDADVLGAYSACTGYVFGDAATDRGANEIDVCRYMETTGMCGHRSSAWGTIDPRNIDHLKWGIQVFGGVRLGIAVPDSMETQFSAGEPFRLVPGARPLDEGHDVCLVHYDYDAVWCVTWGKRWPADWAWVTEYADEAHVELFADWIRAQGTAPPGLDLAGLEADLRELTA